MRNQKHIIVILLFIFLFFGNDLTAQEFPEPYPPMPEALEALESDQDVTFQKIEVAGWEEGSSFYYAFEPKRKKPTVGFIIYPGGLVDPASYDPTARAIAARGFFNGKCQDARRYGGRDTPCGHVQLHPGSGNARKRPSHPAAYTHAPDQHAGAEEEGRQGRLRRRVRLI